MGVYMDYVWIMGHLLSGMHIQVDPQYRFAVARPVLLDEIERAAKLLRCGCPIVV